MCICICIYIYIYIYIYTYAYIIGRIGLGAASAAVVNLEKSQSALRVHAGRPAFLGRLPGGW